MLPIDAIETLKLHGAPEAWIDLLRIWEVEKRMGQTHKAVMIELIAEKALLELARAGIT